MLLRRSVVCGSNGQWVADSRAGNTDRGCRREQEFLKRTEGQLDCQGSSRGDFKKMLSSIVLLSFLRQAYSEHFEIFLIEIVKQRE